MKHHMCMFYMPALNFKKLQKKLHEHTPYFR